MLWGIGSHTVWGQTDTIAHQELEEVVIIAKLPRVEMQSGKMTYRMDATITQSQGSAFDVLSSLPGVILQSDGSVYLNGKAGVNIMMDGKLTYLSGQDLVSLLKSTPAGVIDKIDLISQPSARYDASGNAGIIDIRTKKIIRKGMNLSLDGSYERWKHGTGFGSASLNMRTNKFNFYLSYSHFQSRTQHEVIANRDIFPISEQEQEATQIELNSLRLRRNRSNYYRVGVDYQVSDKTSVGFSTDGNLGNDQELGDVSSLVDSPKTNHRSAFRTLNDTDRSRNNFTTTLNLTHTFNPDGGILDASADYLRYRFRENQLLHGEDTLRGMMNGGIHLYSGQANLVQPFSETFTLRAGVKSTFVSIDNGADYERLQDILWNPDREISSDFKYDENINAAYAQLDINFASFRIEAGLRMENTRIESTQSGNSSQQDSTSKSQYTHLFPNLSLQYRFKSGNSLALTYGKRITRPNYRDLNPFIYIFDDYTYEQGNTLLKPELTDNIELSYLHKDLFRVSLQFSYTQDAIIKSYLDKGSYRVYVTPDNLSSRLSLGPQISTSQLPITSFWDVNLSASLTYNLYRLPDNYPTDVNKRLTLSTNLSNQFNLGNNWSVELSGFYNGKMAMGQATVYPLWQVNAGIRKKIWNDKGSIRLFARDVFRSNVSKISLQAPNLLGRIEEWQDNAVIGVSVSYRLNRGLEVKESRQKSSINESKRIDL
jgi:outer membrane receptor protein involved in Fe transport